jgi:hypothetical protein
MRHVFSFAFVAAIAAAASGCIPVYDFTGDYDMTWDAVLTYQGQDGRRDVTAGTSLVRIRAGVGEELLVDLGADFCRVSALYVKAEVPQDEPYFTIAPQPCWFGPGQRMLTISGTGTFVDGEERLAIVVAGVFEDGEVRGSATIDFSPTW